MSGVVGNWLARVEPVVAPRVTDDLHAYRMLHTWARKNLPEYKVEDVGGWAYIHWIERGRPFLGHALMRRNICVDALRGLEGRRGTNRNIALTTPHESIGPEESDDFPTLAYTAAPNIEAMIDIQRLWDRHGSPNMGEGAIDGEANNRVTLYDDPRALRDDWLAWI